ncbi:DUF4468 domain-containing protein [Solirubrum puertoriconensis]|uniref:DUF4468 domain-containing protein n=1 Tax=Solirubrum puertoriconensis TaxID=1751427 RepID=A0A9X0HLN9_SOLP1|nr:DUF4468 domain-containing protein [Solirubrum puertoriconensis]KUG08084.1 hypothetical protein ASU33_07745 [Solirubrum puertoriconensis]
MKSPLLLLGLLLGLLAGAPALAQSDTAPIEYSERVPADSYGRATLHARAQDWVERRFAYGPKTDFATNAGAGTLRVLGTVKLKPLDNKGQEAERTARFEFTFQATDEGYTYSVGAFRVITNPQNLDTLIPLDEYLTQLRAEKSNERTKNDRRVRAQANSLASEIAMSFRSYMNQIPANEDGSVGLPASNENH